MAPQDIAAPGPPAHYGELRNELGSGVLVEVNTRQGRLSTHSLESKVATTSGAGVSFSLLDGESIDIRASDYSASAVGAYIPGMIRIRFQVNVTNRLSGVELVPSDHRDGWSRTRNSRLGHLCVDVGYTLQVATSIFGDNAADFSTDVDCVDEATFATNPSLGNRVQSPGLLAPLASPWPDFRPGVTSAAATGTPPAADGFFDPLAAYVGAVPLARIPAANIPWYAGWTDHW
jgi:hypothetical protein